MNKESIKKIPYGISDFRRIKREGFHYIDKTSFIKDIENSPPYLFFIRPRRFGKSLWMSLLECYYDIYGKNEFEELFKGTYIGDSPTEEKNKYFILKFNFSSVKSEIDKVEQSFNLTIKIACLEFLKKYESRLKEDSKKYYKKIENTEDASEILKLLCSFVKSKGKIYLLIDEYDNFTNTVISSYGEEQYAGITHGEGFYRHFFNVIKAGTTGPDAPISKLFITGVSPVTMDDVTSGFNIGYNVSVLPAFNEMVGFTEEEVISLINYYREKKLIKDIPEKLIKTMKQWYNNYLFSEDKNTRMYNSDMILYFLNEYINLSKIPKDMLDHNIKIDYKKLKYLIITDTKGKLKINGNFEKLKMILEDGKIDSNIIKAFPAHRIIDPENFISLLYFFGLLTIKEIEYGMPVLTIPNETVRQIYYEYIREGYRDTDIFTIDLFRLAQLFKGMSYKGEWEKLIDYIASEMNSQLTLRDYIHGEKSVQTFLRAYLNFSNYYITKTEPELNKGYCDILMAPNLHSFPDIPYSYIFELKYIKVKDFTEKLLKQKVDEAKKELDRYVKEPALSEYIGSSELVKIILVFSGAELKYKEIY